MRPRTRCTETSTRWSGRPARGTPRPRATWATALLVAMLGPSTLLAQAPRSLEVADPAWEFLGEGSGVHTVGGRPAIRIASGFAIREDVRLTNGTVSFDLYMPEGRSFVYLEFRIQEAGEFEEIYFRPHKRGLPDALQYAPVFQGRSAWQLYHGETGTTAVALPANRWIPVRVELDGSTLRVFVGEGEEPSMVTRMARDPGSGHLALRGFIPAGSDAPFAGAWTNLTVNDRRPAGPAAPEPVAPEGTIRSWRVSQPFDPSTLSGAGPVASELPAGVEDGEWRRIAVQPSGFLELLRHVRIPEGLRPWAVAAEAELVSDRDQVVALRLGYSDVATVWLNGAPLYHGDASYRFGQNRQDGVLHPDQAVLYLPLRSGSNTLRIVVSDGFGGWALQAAVEGTVTLR